MNYDTEISDDGKQAILNEVNELKRLKPKGWYVKCSALLRKIYLAESKRPLRTATCEQYGRRAVAVRGRIHEDNYGENSYP